MEDDDDIDNLFEEEEEDPAKTVLPAPVPVRHKKKSKTEELEEELRKLPTEKEKLRKLAEVAAKNTPVPASDAKPKKKKKKAEAAPVPSTAPLAEKVIPLFPHAGDVKRVEAMLFMTVESAWRSSLPDGDARKIVTDELEYGAHAAAFNKRCGVFSRQLKASLIEFFTQHGNTAMADVVNQLSSCVLHIFPQPKCLVPEKVPICIWSGKPIAEPSAVRSVALVPKKKENEALAAAFHLHLDFVPVLKAIYTSMYFVRIVAERVTENFTKVSPPLPDWKLYFSGWLDASLDPSQVEKAKRDNLVADFVGRAQSQLCRCVDVMKAMLPQETFIVKTE